MSHSCIFGILLPRFDDEWTAATAAALAQTVVYYLLVQVLFGGPYRRALAVDHGVRRLSTFPRVRAVWIAYAAAFIAHMVTAYAVSGVTRIAHHSPKPPADVYLQSGVAVALVANTVFMYNSVWEQRPLPLILINAGAQIVLGLTAGLVMFCFQA